MRRGGGKPRPYNRKLPIARVRAYLIVWASTPASLSMQSLFRMKSKIDSVPENGVARWRLCCGAIHGLGASKSEADNGLIGFSFEIWPRLARILLTGGSFSRGAVER